MEVVVCSLAAQVDPVYFETSYYYFVPVAAGQRPYTLRSHALQKKRTSARRGPAAILAASARAKLDVVAEAFNLFNRANVGQINPVFGPGPTALPGFLQPLTALGARRVQFSLDFEF